MKNSVHYKINTPGEKDLSTRHMKALQPFLTYILGSCVLYAQWNNRQVHRNGNKCLTNSPYPCVFSRKQANRLWSWSTVLEWSYLIFFSWKGMDWVGRQQKNCPTSSPWKQIILGQWMLHICIFRNTVKKTTPEYMHLHIAYKAVPFIPGWSQELGFGFVSSYTLSSGDKHTNFQSNVMIL